MLTSCAPVNNVALEKIKKTQSVFDNKTPKKKIIKKEKTIIKNKTLDKKTVYSYPNKSLQKDITIIFSKNDSKQTVHQFINIVELAVYQKKIKNISFSIELYNDTFALRDLLNNTNLEGKIFIGPLNSNDTNVVKEYCNKGAIFFSFSSNTDLANKCVFLVNFFPENEMKAVFNFFPDNSKISLLYPENKYGFGINSIIDKIANQTNSVIVNRASYNENLSNVREAIKELGKYELRKYELNRQKKILASKKDDVSKKRLIKLERFQTTKDFDFTHVIIADYGLRLLQVAPLLPYYDIDPDVVRFVGTGAWDDKVFYNEPSLNNAIYPGIDYKKRQQLNNDYFDLFEEKLLRTSTLPYDLVGLFEYLISNNYTTSTFYEMFEQGNLKFAGVDGNFYFLKNKIERELQILQIKDGNVTAVSN